MSEEKETETKNKSQSSGNNGELDKGLIYKMQNEAPKKISKIKHG